MKIDVGGAAEVNGAVNKVISRHQLTIREDFISLNKMDNDEALRRAIELSLQDQQASEANSSAQSPDTNAAPSGAPSDAEAPTDAQLDADRQLALALAASEQEQYALAENEGSFEDSDDAMQSERQEEGESRPRGRRRVGRIARRRHSSSSSLPTTTSGPRPYTVEEALALYHSPLAPPPIDALEILRVPAQQEQVKIPGFEPFLSRQELTNLQPQAPLRSALRGSATNSANSSPILAPRARPSGGDNDVPREEKKKRRVSFNSKVQEKVIEPAPQSPSMARRLRDRASSMFRLRTGASPTHSSSPSANNVIADSDRKARRVSSPPPTRDDDGSVPRDDASFERALFKLNDANETRRIVHSYMGRQLRDAASPYGSLLNHFVLCKFEALHKKAAAKTAAKAAATAAAASTQSTSAAPASSVSLVEIESPVLPSTSPPAPAMDEATREALAAEAAEEQRQRQVGQETALAFINDLHSSILSRYRALRTSSHGATALTEVIEDVLFTKILDLYKERHRGADERLADKQRQLRTISPAHLGLAEPFWLLSETATQAPYGAAIDEMRKLTTLPSPQRKLRCLVRVASLICKCIHSFNRAHKRERVQVTVESLLPLFAYVTIKSNLAGLCSESRFLEDFVAEEKAIEEEGYTLATFQTALKIIEQLDAADMAASVSQILADERGDDVQVKLVDTEQ